MQIEPVITVDKAHLFNQNVLIFFFSYFTMKTWCIYGYIYMGIYSLLAVKQGPVVQSIVSLMSSLRVISLTVLADSIHNILIFFAEKM